MIRRARLCCASCKYLGLLLHLGTAFALPLVWPQFLNVLQHLHCRLMVGTGCSLGVWLLVGLGTFETVKRLGVLDSGECCC